MAKRVRSCLLLCLAGLAAVFILTKDEKAQMVSVPVKLMNPASQNEVYNPLELQTCNEIANAVGDYYDSLANNMDYIESYQNLLVYSKNGMYPDTYVIFVKYDMKIKDIYTPAPGLSTLYAKVDVEKNVIVESEVREHDVQGHIARMTTHTDVQELFGQVEKEYAQAVQSDATLSDALVYLQEAVSEKEGESGS